MCAYFCYKVVHCGIFAWCIVGFEQKQARSITDYGLDGVVNEFMFTWEMRGKKIIEESQ